MCRPRRRRLRVPLDSVVWHASRSAASRSAESTGNIGVRSLRVAPSQVLLICARLVATPRLGKGCINKYLSPGTLGGRA